MDGAAPNVITLEVRDAQALRAFYTQLGFVEAVFDDNGTVHLLGDGIVIVLSPRDDLTAAAWVAPSQRADGAFGGAVLTVRVGAGELVDVGCELVRLAGGTVMAEPSATLWGSRRAYVADPEGNIWQLLWAPDALDAPPASASRAVAQE
jgi:uncharacterized protein